MPNTTLPREHAPIRVTWAGNPWSLTGLCLLNILLSVLTLGIYWFWARSEYRRRMWQMVRVEGEPLEYTGTGLELLIGYLKLFLFVILPALAVTIAGQAVLGPQNPVMIVIIAVLYMGFFFLLFAGVFRANRYILSRTRWRGIAFGLDEGAAGYAWTAVWSALLLGLTFGWLWPWRTTALRRRITDAMRFGSAKFRFEGGSGPLYGPFAVSWLCAILAYAGFIGVVAASANLQSLQQGKTIAHQRPAELAHALLQGIPVVAALVSLVAVFLIFVAASWYEARKLNTFASATKADGLGAHLEANAGSTLWLIISNALILFLSLGILRPVTQARRLRYLVNRFSFSGAVDLDKVVRESENAGQQGAGVEAAFSIEIF